MYKHLNGCMTRSMCPRAFHLVGSILLIRASEVYLQSWWKHIQGPLNEDIVTGLPGKRAALQGGCTVPATSQLCPIQLLNSGGKQMFLLNSKSPQWSLWCHWVNSRGKGGGIGEARHLMWWRSEAGGFDRIPLLCCEYPCWPQAWSHSSQFWNALS